jgi:hypothetical protein
LKINSVLLIWLISDCHASSIERFDLGDDFCRSLFVIFLLAILVSVLFRCVDSDYLFSIFKLFLHIKSEELLAQAYATLAKFDTTLTSQFGFPVTKYLFFLLLTLSVPSEGNCRNAYMMWGFWCDCSLFDIERTVGHRSLHFLFIITIHIKSENNFFYYTYIIMLCK